MNLEDHERIYTSECLIEGTMPCLLTDDQQRSRREAETRFSCEQTSSEFRFLLL